MARLSSQKEQLAEEAREARLLIKEKMYSAKNGSLRSTSTNSKESTFVI